MGDPQRRVGAGPYREGRFTTPKRPAALYIATGFGGGAIALATVARLIFERAGAPAVPSRSPSIERASSLAGGARVMAVFADGADGHPNVLRIPGEPRRRGGDVVAAPEVFAANGAVAAVADGEHLRRANGEFLRVREGAVRPLPLDETVLPPSITDVLYDASVVERARDFARTGQGAVLRLRGASTGWTSVPYVRMERATALATDGGTACQANHGGFVVWCADTDSTQVVDAADPFFAGQTLTWVDLTPLSAESPVEQLAVRREVVCARHRDGGVDCVRGNRSEERDPMFRRFARLPFEGASPLATAIALGNEDLCLLTPGRRLHCVHGPQEDAPAQLGLAPLRLHLAMEDVDEVGLADGVGCARRRGRVECWGPLARNGWVVRRDRPVRVEGLRGVTSLVAIDGYVCAESPDGFRCWGLGLHGTPQTSPVRLAAEGDEAHTGHDDRAVAPSRLLVGGRWCAEHLMRGCGNAPRLFSCPLQRSYAARAVHAGVGEVVRGGGLACAVEADGTVSCGDVPVRATDAPAGRSPVAGLDDVAQVVVTADGLACARRRDGGVWCWGDNRSGALTAAEAARGPRVVAIAR